ncbi:Hypothetical predicted protein [Marmota monax]|uniref:Uncharacterized protein n=1 Tax=Marmota monax TaxID=9995 RepID=A0A5E4BS92_MARMO|nr:hypothetical protein GHT09_010243 [Marmota monax]VTJ72365.1 Hypothetical predicted protein [Marmota monax]
MLQSVNLESSSQGILCGATAAVAVSATASASVVVGGGAGRTPGSLPRNEERRPGPALRPGLGPGPGVARVEA